MKRFRGRSNDGQSRGERINRKVKSFGKGCFYTCLMGAFVGCIAAYTSVAPLEYPGRKLLATKHCPGDLVLPLMPGEQTLSVVTRAILYILGLGYLFLGVAISADVFMSSIEVITSKTKTIRLRGQDVEVEVWNATVANLTLMALGSSAPEILLAVVEICALGFKAGDLGPGTIVGSAAFNLLFITAICMSCLDEDLEADPSGGTLEIRRIEEFGVFVITAIASLFAYLWMVIVLMWISKDYVHLWEGILTLVFFPLLVVISWAQDKNWFRADNQVAPESQLKSLDGQKTDGGDKKERRQSKAEEALATIEGAEEMSTEEAAQQAAAAAVAEQHKKKKKSRLEYRIQATRKMTGGKRVMPTNKPKADAKEEVIEEEAQALEMTVGFELPGYQILEGGGHVEVHVIREARGGTEEEQKGLLAKACKVEFDTSDGTAVGGQNYVTAKGDISFEPGETKKMIAIEIIDDNEWAPDENFFVRLFNPSPEINKLATATTSVLILNDDTPGKVSFESLTVHATDTMESIDVKLKRKDGCDGNVLAFVETMDGTAHAGTDYEALAPDTEIHFPDQEMEATVNVKLLKNKTQNATFTVRMTSVEPEGASIGEISMCTVIISNDKNYQKLMDEIVQQMDAEMDKYHVGSSSWSEQFMDAMNMGGDDEEPEWDDYLLHFLSFYWKVFHALVPPTDMCGGWATFGVSLICIGIVTVLVGDMAKMFGCCIGLPDAITAITFVALGTSLPDTFASKEATTQDDTADAAITNVTGSNSVNVFLGLGLPWTMACIYWCTEGLCSTGLYYPAGDSLSYSVVVFFACAVVCIAILVFRRKESIGGELGGPKNIAYGTSAFLVGLWCLYIVMSSLQVKGHVKGL